MDLYICDADQPYSHIELVLTEHRDGTYDASMDIVRNDEHGEPISISLLTSKDGIKHLLPQGEIPALYRAIRELGWEKTKNILLDFLENGGATELREARDELKNRPWKREERAEFYLWVNDYMKYVLFGEDPNK